MLEPIALAEPFAALSHLLAAPAALVLGVLLLRPSLQGHPARTVSFAIFLASVVQLFAVSGVYHLLARDSAERFVMWHLDHAAIWLLIAGTFTPFHVVLMRGFWRYGMLAIVWGCAVTAIVLQTIWLEHIPPWLVNTFYLALGWLGALSCIRAAREHGFARVRHIIYGGIAYSIGATLDVFGQPTLIPGVVGSHEVFHVAVIAGVAFHFRFMFDVCGSPAPVRAIAPYRDASPKYLRSIAS